MTATQIPILGPERRFLTRAEGLRLQEFEPTHELPARARALSPRLGTPCMSTWCGGSLRISLASLLGPWKPGYPPDEKAESEGAEGGIVDGPRSSGNAKPDHVPHQGDGEQA